MALKAFSQYLAELPELSAMDGSDYLLALDNPNASASKTKPTSSSIPVLTIPASGASQSLIIPSNGDVCYDITLTTTCTLSISGGTSGRYQTVTLILRGALPYVFANTIKWQAGVAPAPNLIAGKMDKITITTPDAGATLFGSY